MFKIFNCKTLKILFENLREKKILQKLSKSLRELIEKSREIFLEHSLRVLGGDFDMGY